MAEEVIIQDENTIDSGVIIESSSIEEQPKKSQFEWVSIHILQSGEVQYITNDANKKCHINALNVIQHVIDIIYLQKPVENEYPNEYLSINIFNDTNIEWQVNDTEKWTIDFQQIDVSNIDLLISELIQIAQ